MCSVLACVALSAAPLPGCGGGDPTETAAAQILRQTFRSSASAIEDGHLSLSLRLDVRGSGAVGEPVLVTLLGPFSGSAAAGLGRFDVEFGRPSRSATTSPAWSRPAAGSS